MQVVPPPLPSAEAMVWQRWMEVALPRLQVGLHGGRGKHSKLVPFTVHFGGLVLFGSCLHCQHSSPGHVRGVCAQMNRKRIEPVKTELFFSELTFGALLALQRCSEKHSPSASADHPDYRHQAASVRKKERKKRPMRIYPPSGPSRVLAQPTPAWLPRLLKHGLGMWLVRGVADRLLGASSTGNVAR